MGLRAFTRNIQAEVTGIGPPGGDDTTPCESRLKNSWGYPVWMKASTIADESYAEFPGQTPYDPGLTVFAHEIGHTWLAAAQYMKDGERRLMTAGGGSHWAFELHAPAPFPWWGGGSVRAGPTGATATPSSLPMPGNEKCLSTTSSWSTSGPSRAEEWRLLLRTPGRGRAAEPAAGAGAQGDQHRVRVLPAARAGARPRAAREVR